MQLSQAAILGIYKHFGTTRDTITSIVVFNLNKGFLKFVKPRPRKIINKLT
jgi:hypothetical protein